MIHELKTDPVVFKAVQARLKRFEIRKADRNFQVGDILLLKETAYSGEEMKQGKPLVYTTEQLAVEVLHILYGPIYGLEKDWCIMSIDII